MVTVWGVADEDGSNTFVPFTVRPEQAELLGVADLDGNNTDELVLALPTGLEIVRVRDGALSKIAGPPVTLRAHGRSSCVGDVEIVAEGNRDVLAITIDNGPHGKGCPSPGRHELVLDGDHLVQRR
jgi:hypothetical protein